MVPIVLLVLSIASNLLPLLFGHKKRYTVLWWYVLTSLVFDLLVTTLRRVFDVQYHWATNLFVLTEFVFVSYVYRDRILKHPYVFYGVLVTVGGYFIVDTLCTTMLRLNTFGYSLFLLAYIIYSICGLLSILKRQEVVFLETSSFFWMNVAFIIYASGDFLSILFTSYIQDRAHPLFVFLWSVSFKIFNIVKNIFLAKAVSCRDDGHEPQ